MSELLSQLQSLLHALYDPNSTLNKKQLEQQLEDFKHSAEGWKYSISFCQLSQDNYVLFFAVSVFESTVTKRWHLLIPQDKGMLRTFIIDYLLSKNQELPQFVTTKLAKTIADIARRDWPEEYPNFFEQIQLFMENPDSSIIGLQILLVACEEFVNTSHSSRSPLLASHKQELRNALSNQLPFIVNLLKVTLSDSMNTFRNFPENAKLINNAVIKINLTLKCLLQLISWAPLSSHLDSVIVDYLLQFVGEADTDYGVTAIQCFIEIIEKKFVPPEYDIFMLKVATKICQNLESITSNPSAFVNLNVTYVDVLTEFINALLKNHVVRLSQNGAFPFNDFLILLYKYTFIQNTVESLMSCLEIWSFFVDHVHSLNEGENDLVLSKAPFMAGLSELMMKLLQLIQFSNPSSAAVLSSLDDSDSSNSGKKKVFGKISGSYDVEEGIDVTEILEADFSIDEIDNKSHATELDSFMDTCVSLIIRIASLPGISREMLTYLHPTLSLLWNLYNTTSKMTISTVRDLHTSLCVIGALTSYFVKDFESQIANALQLLQLTLEIVKIGLNNRIYTLGAHHSKLIVRGMKVIFQFHSCHWLKLYELKDASDVTYQNTINSIVDVILLSLDTSIAPAPEEVQIASLQLLRSLCESMQPSCLRMCPSMQDLFTNWERISSSLQLIFRGSLFSSVTLAILVPCPNLAKKWDDEFTNRVNIFKVIISPLVKVLEEITKLSGEHEVLNPSVLAKIEKSAIIISLVIFTIRKQSDTLRKVIFEGCEGVFSSLHSMFPFLLQSSVSANPSLNLLNTVIRITNFHLVSFDCLKRQLGMGYVNATVTQYINTFASLSSESMLRTSMGSTLYIKFMVLLSMVVSERSNSIDAILPAINQLILNQLSFILNDDYLPRVEDLRFSLYQLIYFVLTEHFKFFVKTNIGSLTRGGRVVNPETEKDFFGLFQIVNSSIIRRNIEPRSMKLNLKVLSQCDVKHYLFTLPVFGEGMIESFVLGLLDVYIGFLEFMREEVGVVLFNLAKSNFKNFYEVLLPSYLSRIEITKENDLSIKLRSSFGCPVDEPTFAASLENLSNDLSYFFMLQRK